MRRYRFLFPLVPIAFVSLATYVTMELWNWIMPELFGLGMLTFWKALGVLLLSKLLFGFGRGGGRGRWGRHGHGGGCGPWRGGRGGEEWRNRLQQRWNALTPEQRKKYAERCGWKYEDAEAMLGDKGNAGTADKEEN